MERPNEKIPERGLVFLIKTPTIQYIEVLLSHTGQTNSETEAHAIKLDLPGDTDCKSALETMKEGKMGPTHEINSLLFSIGAFGKSCNFQWIPAHVDIQGNEMTDSLANEAGTLEPLT
ncbi:hypothetical protein TNCV_423811 [Trichonephila clavipes]|nr:hypothetical protein TNCV_423811 [Trichonephila clavipes]